MNQPIIITTSFGGYSILGLAEDRLSPEDLPVPPGISEPLQGAVEPVYGGVFVWALSQTYEDESVAFRMCIDDVADWDELPAGCVVRQFGIEAEGDVVVNTFDWEYVTTLAVPLGSLQFELLMMPRGVDGSSRETHYLRLAPDY